MNCSEFPNNWIPSADISTFADLEAMSNAEIANIRGLGLRGYKEILENLGRQTDDRSRSKNSPKKR